MLQTERMEFPFIGSSRLISVPTETSCHPGAPTDPAFQFLHSHFSRRRVRRLHCLLDFNHRSEATTQIRPHQNHSPKIPYPGTKCDVAAEPDHTRTQDGQRFPSNQILLSHISSWNPSTSSFRFYISATGVRMPVCSCGAPKNMFCGKHTFLRFDLWNLRLPRQSRVYCIELF